MAANRLVHTVEMLAPDGSKFELDQDGWRVQNVRQMGEVQRLAALVLLARLEALAPYPPPEPKPFVALVEDAERVATRLGLRITHRRSKSLKRR